jgi:hypothetical protein
MPHHSVTAPDVATGAVVGTYKTLLGIKAANTTGHRARLRKLLISPTGEAPQDVNVNIRVSKTNNTADGTSTAVTPKAKDAASLASNLTCGKNYSVEPTAVDSQHFTEYGLNGRGSHVLEWGPLEAPVWGKNETLVIQGSPGSASAVKLSIAVEYEEY